METAESSSNIMIYAMDETYIRLESQNRRSWSVKGVSPILEKNNPHIGVNIIGASTIHGKFETFADVYSSEESICNNHVCNFIDLLLEINSGKTIYIIMDNARIHNCDGMKSYLDNKKNLVFINLPPYSPDLNPQENIWNRVKNCIFSNRARSCIDELFNDIVDIYNILNQNSDITTSLTYGKHYYK
ncbi:transposase [Clostridium sp. PL3]|uniref:Transposase n=1 Tax=Clostridium thailandense TaxID=2794346 RepID=A0A949U5J7_9CLOT|nr:transposase [Clostridium thailandense]MBV7276869.1 transposase [Clostridium thailandense]